MSARFWFSPDALRRGIALAKVVTPERGDFCFRFTDGRLSITSVDKRRFVTSVVRPDASDGGESLGQSKDFYITTDRTSLFESTLASIVITVAEKSMTISAEGGDQTRSATLKMRNESSRRPPVPVASPPPAGACSVPRRGFERLLRLASCSALIKETKTDEEMRINQVHFYPDPGCAMSNARYYGTVAFMPGLGLDLSVVSADLPQFRSFCAKGAGDSVVLHQDSNRMYMTDPDSGSALSVVRVSSKKPALSLLGQDGFPLSVFVGKTILSDALGWACTAIEGTQRITFHAKRSEGSESGTMRLLYGSQEVSSLPVRFETGKELLADFPVQHFSNVVSSLDDGDVRLRLGHPDGPSMLEVSAGDASKDGIRSVHYLARMKER